MRGLPPALVAQFEGHLSHVDSLWSLQKVNACNRALHTRRYLPLPQMSVDFVVPDVDDELADVKEKLVQHPLKSTSCPALMTMVTQATDMRRAVTADVVVDELEEQTDLPATAAVAKGPAWELDKAEAAESRQAQTRQGCLGQCRNSSSSSRKASWVRSQGVVTLQMYGLSPWLGVDKLLETLNEACGLRGCYNYVHIPRNLRGEGWGYAFINMRSVEYAAQVVELLQGRRLPVMQPGGEDWGPVMFGAAKQQGYGACMHKVQKQYSRVRNSVLHPYVTTEDGLRLLMAPPEALLFVSSGGGSSSSSSSGAA